VQTRFRTTCLLAIVAAVSLTAAGQSGSQANGDPNSPLGLAKIEDDVIRDLSTLQEKSPRHKVSAFTHSKSARQIACSLSVKNEHYLWSGVLNKSGEGDLGRLAEIDSRIVGEDVGVGAWFAITPDHPEGAYWVVARPLPTKNPVWYLLSVFTDDPFLRSSRKDGTYPVTTACSSLVH